MCKESRDVQKTRTVSFCSLTLEWLLEELINEEIEVKCSWY